MSAKIDKKIFLRRFSFVTLKIVAGILLFVYIIIALANTTIVQSLGASWVASYFSKEWKTKVRIGAISVNLFDGVGLHDVFLCSPKGDTILNAQSISAQIFSLPSAKGITLNKVKLSNTQVNLIKYTDGMNFAFIIKYFKSNKPSKPKKKKAPFILQVKNLAMDNVSFSLKMTKNLQPDHKGRVNLHNMRYSAINANMQDIKIIRDSIMVKINYFNLKEHSGFALNNLSGNFTVSHKGIKAQDANLRTGNTNLNFDARLKTNSWHTYSSFVDSVYCVVNFKKDCYAVSSDASAWSKAVDGMSQKVYFNAQAYGRINNLQIEKCEVKTEGTLAKVSGHIIGLPHIKNTWFDVAIGQIKTSASEIKSLKFGSIMAKIKIPDILTRLGDINLKGAFCGSLSDFVTKDNLITSIGSLNIKGKAQTLSDQTTYSVAIASQAFDIGTLLDNPQIITRKFSVDANVCGTSLATLKADAKVELYNLGFKGTKYDTLTVDGQMQDEKISAKVFLASLYARLGADVDLSLKDNKSIYVDADIDKLMPKGANLIASMDSNTCFSTKIIADISSLDMKHLSGNVDMENLKINIADTQSFLIKRFSAQLSSKDTQSNLSVYSDILDLSLNGHYTLSEILEDVSKIALQYIPAFNFGDTTSTQKELKAPSSIINNSSFEFSSTLKNPKPLLALFAHKIELSKNIAIFGSYNANDKLILNLAAQKIGIGSISMENLFLDSRVRENYLNTSIKTSLFKVSDSMQFQNVDLNANTNNQEINCGLTFSDKKQQIQTSGIINFKSILVGGILQGGFENSELNILGNRITINNDNIISYNGNKISILNFLLQKDKGKIQVDGTLSKEKEDKLTIDFDNFDISMFNPILKNANIALAGQINNTITFRSILGSPFFTSNLVVDSLMLNNNELGKTFLNINNTATSGEYFVNVKMLHKTKDIAQYSPLTATGFLYPESKTQNLNLAISMQNLSLKVIENYISSFASDCQGTLNTRNLTVKGTFNQPNIHGNLVFNNAAMKINMLGTKYFFNDTLLIDNNRFLLRNFRLIDNQKNSVSINGMVSHHNFADYNINIKAVADKLKILNTTAAAAQSYYGQAYASAKVKISGDTKKLNIDVDAKTEKGTKLYVPMSSKTNVTNNAFITFEKEQPKPTQKEEKPLKQQAPKSSMDYDINVKLSVTPDAVIAMPLNFSQINGDLLASGQGDLQIGLDSKGKFDMFGTIEVESGTFNMAIMNVLDKTFVIEKGGSIQFNGAPQKGTMDIRAIYKTRASLSPILGEGYSKPVDVQSVITLCGALMNPVPKFDIKLPNTDNQTQDLVFMNIDRNNEKQMLEQTASLLLTHQFYSTTGGVDNMINEGSLSSSAFELAFGQINGMLNDMIKVVNIGMNYTPGTEGTTDQFGLNFSKNIGRWELEFNSVFGGKSAAEAQGASSFIGDINIDYKLTEALRLKAFNKSNANDFTKYNITPYTQGVGITYKKEYESFSDIFHLKQRTKKTNNTQTNSNNNLTPKKR